MMVTCPKCGFSQPKDRYCANCGVDMEAYRPVEAPLLSRVLKSPMLQGAMVVALLVGVFFFLRWQQKQAQQDSQAQLNGAQRAQVTEAKLPSEATSSGSTVAASPSYEPPAHTPAPEPIKVVAAETPEPTPLATETPSTNEIAKKINLVYAEVPRPTLGDLLADARTLVSEGNYSTGIISDLRKHLQAASTSRAVRTLDSQSDQTIHINQPIIVFKGMRDPVSGQNLGLTMQLTPVQNDDQGLHVLVEIQRNLREGAGASATLTEQNFQQDFTIARHAGAYFTGVLPHRPLDDNERQLYSGGGILKILSSPSYQQGASEFVIFIEAL